MLIFIQINLALPKASDSLYILSKKRERKQTNFTQSCFVMVQRFYYLLLGRNKLGADFPFGGAHA